MSADFLLAALVIDARRVPDFEAGHAALERLRAADVECPEALGEEDPDTAAGLGAIREVLHQDLRDLEATLEGSREVDCLSVRGAHVYVTGGMSGGDPPTGTFVAINRLAAVRGVLGAAGFEGES